MRHRLLVGLLVLVLLSACGGSAASPVFNQVNQGLDTGSGTTAGAAPPAAQYAESAEAPASQTQPLTELSGEQSTGAPNAQAQATRLVIRTATLQLLVDKVDDAEVHVRRLADTRGGFVLSSQSSGEDDQRRATVELKVPAQRFDEVIAELTKLGKVEGQDVQGQDVTDEYVDLESRLRNLRAVEARLQQFLAEAKRIEDLLQINQQLSDVQGQIEQTQGRITYLKQSAALSTITVSLYAKEVVSVVPDEGWSPMATARAAAKNLIMFGQGLADLGIVLAVWAPFWLPFLLAALWVRRRLRRPVASAPAAQP